MSMTDGDDQMPNLRHPFDALGAAGPDFTDREQEELLTRLGRGVRAMLGDILLDPLPPDFQRLLTVLEKSERRGGA
jgi:hypothetical protein